MNFNMKRVKIYFEGYSDVFEVGIDNLVDIHFHNEAIKLEYKNGDHRWISGFPFDYYSPKPKNNCYPVGIDDYLDSSGKPKDKDLLP